MTAGCEADPSSDTSYTTDLPSVVRMVEVLSKPAAHQSAFIELRNDGDLATDLNGWGIDLDGNSAKLVPLALPSASSLRGASPSVIEGHGLGLVFDASVEPATALELACETPIATTRQALGPDHAAADDLLASTLELQQQRHCMAVFLVDGLAAALASGRSLALQNASGDVDQAVIELGHAPLGVAFERRGIDADAFDLSPLGATPGARNFHRSDRHLLYDGADAPLPITTMHSSPWRVGDTMLALRRDADALEASGDAAGAEALRQEAQAIYKGKVPHNPLVDAFVGLLAGAQSRAFGAFYQINEPHAIEALAAARAAGADVRIATDGEFAAHNAYLEGFAALDGADVPVIFDPRPSALAHNKFLAVDGQWLWTGSFNPIDDEPSRIHADNTLVIRSAAVAQLHEQEAKIMYQGAFGTDKRKLGVAGGRYQVDGAPISVRFSPGMTKGSLQKRATEMTASGDPLKACDARMPNGNNAVPERYRDLDPCGGPYDLIVGEVARAKSSVYFVSFSLSLDDLETVILERYAAGVDVRGVVDPTVSTRGIVEALNDGGADVRYTPNSDPACASYISPQINCPANPNKVWLHHKFIVIDHGTDHPVVITGSHNLSSSAEDKNDEALLVIRDRAVAESYYRMFREVYDHPQTMGGHNTTAGIDSLAITEVLASADPSAPQFVEIQNLGYQSATLDGLELWNRNDAPVALDGELAAGQRLVVAVGPVPVSPEARVMALEPGLRPFITPATSLVIRQSDHRWVTTYDPYTAAHNLPADAPASTLGSARAWTGLSRAQLDAWTLELLGHNATPEAPVPTWQPKGLYSDWADENDVTDTRLILSRAPLATWTEQQPTPGW